MPREKKTRKQKIMSDSRRTKTFASETGTYSLSSISAKTAKEKTIAPASATHTIVTQNYHYLVHDLKKTLFVTILVIVIQVLLHTFVLK
jgi:hypothetical protein